MPGIEQPVSDSKVRHAQPVLRQIRLIITELPCSGGGCVTSLEDGASNHGPKRWRQLSAAAFSIPGLSR